MDSAAIQSAGAVGATQVNPTEPSARAGRAAGTGKVAATPAASLDAIPSSPPPEVLEQMAQAQRTYERLTAHGRSLDFGRDSAGRPTVEIRDRTGQLVRTLSLPEVLDLAAGATLEQR